MANAKSFLIKADRAGPSLRLLYQKYSIPLSRVLDAAAKRCLYVRIQSATNASEAIILRDLRDDTEVAIDQSCIGSYFAPHFYRDGVLFYSHDELWRADLDGNNHIRLIPPLPVPK
jgi:tricorn protease-like protein